MHPFSFSGKYLHLFMLISCQNNALISELCGTGYFLPDGHLSYKENMSA